MVNTDQYALTSNQWVTPSVFPDMRKYWSNQFNLWQKYNDTYMGAEYMRKASYLPKMSTENDAEYTNRFKYASYMNIVYRVIADYNKYIYNKSPNRTGLDSYISLVDYMNSNMVVNIDSFFRDVFSTILLFGECYISVEDSSTDPLVSDGDRIELGLKYITKPIPPYRVPVFNDKRAVLIMDNSTYIIIYPDRVERYENGSIVSTIENIHNFIPLRKLMIDEDDNGYGESIVRDIADMAIEIYQINSTLRLDFLKESFSPFMLPMSPELNEQYEMIFPKNSDGSLDLTIRDIMPIPSDANPMYLSKDLSYIDRKRNYLTDKITDIREHMSLRLNKILTQSGIAKQYDFQDTNASLQLLADVAQNIEYQWWDLFFSIVTDDTPEYSIEYNKVFDIRDKSEYLSTLNSSYDMYKDVSPIWSKVMLNEIVNEQHNLPMEIRKNIEQQINDYIDKQFNNKE